MVMRSHETTSIIFKGYKCLGMSIAQIAHAKDANTKKSPGIIIHAQNARFSIGACSFQHPRKRFKYLLSYSHSRIHLNTYALCVRLLSKRKARLILKHWHGTGIRCICALNAGSKGMITKMTVGSKCLRCLWLTQKSGNCRLSESPALVNDDMLCLAFTPVQNMCRVCE